MKPVTKQNIDDFLNCKTIAIAGVSRNEKSFSAQVAVHLQQLGYELWQINPNFDQTLLKEKKVKTISEMPPNVNNLLILTSSSQTESVLQQAIEKGIKQIWIQQKSDTPTTLKMGFESGINMIYGHCIFMFSQPEGFHKFHYNLKKFFGGIPK